MPVISDTVLLGLPLAPVNNASVTAYKASRFSGVPAENVIPPAGSPDAGPVISGPVWGSEGAFQITVPTAEDYYCRVAIGGVAAWKLYPDAGGNPLTAFAYVNSWVDDSGAVGQSVAGYRLVQGGTHVELVGAVKAGTTATIATLPAGFRPPALKACLGANIGAGGVSEIDITAAGVLRSSVFGVAAQISIDGIVFPIDA